MGRWVDVGAADELTEGTMRTVTVDGPPLLIAHVGDAYYAAEGRCPHMGGRLAEGKLEGTVVTCPRHGSRFDLTDGQVLRWTEWSGLVLSLAKVFKSPRSLVTYATRIDEGRVLVEVPGDDS